MNIDELLDLMEETMEEASGLPFSGSKRMVDIDKMRDIIDEVRLNMPTEIRQAKAIVNDRADIIASAKREAEAIVKKAEDRARVLVGEEQIVRAAQQRAAEILSSAQSQSRETAKTCCASPRSSWPATRRRSRPCAPTCARTRRTITADLAVSHQSPVPARTGRHGAFCLLRAVENPVKIQILACVIYCAAVPGGKNTQNRKNMQPNHEKAALGRDFSRFFFGAISCN